MLTISDFTDKVKKMEKRKRSDALWLGNSSVIIIKLLSANPQLKSAGFCLVRAKQLIVHVFFDQDKHIQYTLQNQYRCPASHTRWHSTPNLPSFIQSLFTFFFIYLFISFLFVCRSLSLSLAFFPFLFGTISNDKMLLHKFGFEHWNASQLQQSCQCEHCVYICDCTMYGAVRSTVYKMRMHSCFKNHVDAQHWRLVKIWIQLTCAKYRTSRISHL